MYPIKESDVALFSNSRKTKKLWVKIVKNLLLF